MAMIPFQFLTGTQQHQMLTATDENTLWDHSKYKVAKEFPDKPIIKDASDLCPCEDPSRDSNSDQGAKLLPKEDLFHDRYGIGKKVALTFRSACHKKLRQIKPSVPNSPLSSLKRLLPSWGRSHSAPSPRDIEMFPRHPERGSSGKAKCHRTIAQSLPNVREFVEIGMTSPNFDSPVAVCSPVSTPPSTPSESQDMYDPLGIALLPTPAEPRTATLTIPGRSYALPFDSLTSLSGYFRQRLAGTPSPEQDQITFTDMEIPPFNVLCYWLDTQRLPSSPSEWLRISGVSSEPTRRNLSQEAKLALLPVEILTLAYLFEMPEFAAALCAQQLECRADWTPFIPRIP